MTRNVPPKVTETAKHIASADMPPWLVVFLCDWLPSLSLDHAVHQTLPSKTDMRENLRKVGNAAAVLQRALRHTPTREFLESEGRIQIENRGGLDHTLYVISDRAALAAASPRISAKAAAKKGRGKALPTNGFTPKVFCAAIIIEVWKFLHGEYPAPRNAKAAAAADAYWRASGGVTKSWGSNSLSSWSYHFKRARLQETEKIRQEIRRHCVEHSHSHQLLSQDVK